MRARQLRDGFTLTAGFPQLKRPTRRNVFPAIRRNVLNRDDIASFEMRGQVNRRTGQRFRADVAILKNGDASARAGIDCRKFSDRVILRDLWTV